MASSHQKRGPARPAERRGYESPLRAEQSDATRERILVAAEAHLAEDPERFSYPEVARLARVSLPTVHRHFPTQRSLYEGIHLRVNARMNVTEARPVSREELHGSIDGFFERWGALGPAERALHRARLSQDARREHGHPEKRRRIREIYRTIFSKLSPAEAARLERAMMLIMSSETVRTCTERLGFTPREGADAVRFVLTAIEEKASSDARKRRATSKERRT